MTENRTSVGMEDEDDVVGHPHFHADAEAGEGEDDVVAHRYSYAADAEAGEDEDDVVGHVQPPRDLGR
jgi:hypothetical protein